MDDTTIKILLWALTSFGGLMSIILMLLLVRMGDIKKSLDGFHAETVTNIHRLDEGQKKMEVEQAKLDGRVNMLEARTA